MSFNKTIHPNQITIDHLPAEVLWGMLKKDNSIHLTININGEVAMVYYVTQKRIQSIIMNPGEHQKEKFLCHEDDTWVAVDNRHGEAYTESFDCLFKAMTWLVFDHLSAEDVREHQS